MTGLISTPSSLSMGRNTLRTSEMQTPPTTSRSMSCGTGPISPAWRAAHDP
ncbi:MAG: hypothetical protein ACRDWW_08065 [Acidimicrobiales bacterium]